MNEKRRFRFSFRLRKLTDLFFSGSYEREIRQPCSGEEAPAKALPAPGQPVNYPHDLDLEVAKK